MLKEVCRCVWASWFQNTSFPVSFLCLLLVDKNVSSQLLLLLLNAPCYDGHELTPETVTLPNLFLLSVALVESFITAIKM